MTNNFSTSPFWSGECSNYDKMRQELSLIFPKKTVIVDGMEMTGPIIHESGSGRICENNPLDIFTMYTPTGTTIDQFKILIKACDDNGFTFYFEKEGFMVIKKI